MRKFGTMGGLKIEDEFISQQTIERMTFEETKMLVSNLEDDIDLDRVVRWRPKCPRTEGYVSELYRSIN